MDLNQKERVRDLKLVRRVATGDERALELLYSSYADVLFAFIYHRLDGSRADAEDIWQETLLAMLDSLPAYNGESRLFTWMCGIARHKIADHYRYSDRRITSAAEVSPGQLAEIISDAPLPEEILMRPAAHAVVIEALATLPEQYRLALMARYTDEKSTSEVAKMLHRTYKATESLLSRARSAFREALIQLEEMQDGK